MDIHFRPHTTQDEYLYISKTSTCFQETTQQFLLNSAREKQATNSQPYGAIDQCHEENNAIVKDSAERAIGLITNPGALRCWMVDGPEVQECL